MNDDILEPGMTGAITGDPEASDPFIELTAGMAELPADTDRDRLTAAYELAARIKLNDMVVGYDDDDPPPDWWFARAELAGGFTEVRGLASPDDAAERLLRKVCNGGRCTSCGRVMSLSSTLAIRGEAICRWHRDGRHWLRGCLDTHDEGQAQNEALTSAGLTFDPDQGYRLDQGYRATDTAGPRLPGSFW